MMKLTEKQKQWLWFVALWLGGFTTAFTAGSIIKGFMALIPMP